MTLSTSISLLESLLYFFISSLKFDQVDGIFSTCHGHYFHTSCHLALSSSASFYASSRVSTLISRVSLTLFSSSVTDTTSYLLPSQLCCFPPTLLLTLGGGRVSRPIFLAVRTLCVGKLWKTYHTVAEVHRTLKRQQAARSFFIFGDTLQRLSRFPLYRLAPLEGRESKPTPCSKSPRACQPLHRLPDDVPGAYAKAPRARPQHPCQHSACSRQQCR